MVVFVIVHWLLLTVTSTVCMGRGMHRLDHSNLPVTTIELLCRQLMSILQEPYEAFIHVIHFPGGWMGIIPGILTSFLWGTAAATVLVFFDRRR
jgi:hypothetical protein